MPKSGEHSILVNDGSGSGFIIDPEEEMRAAPNLFQKQAPFQPDVLWYVPTLGTVDSQWAVMLKAMEVPKNTLLLVDDSSHRLDFKYTRACWYTLHSHAEWLFCLEHDNLLQPWGLRHLLDAAAPKDGVKILSGWARKRDAKNPQIMVCKRSEDPRKPFVFWGTDDSKLKELAAKEQETKLHQLIEVDGVPTCCLLIHRSVLEAFSKQGVQPFVSTFQMQHPDWPPDYPPLGLTHDLDFCFKAKALGFSIHVDPAVEVGHIAKVTL